MKKTKAKTKNKTQELKRVAPKFIQIMMAGDLDCLPTKLEKKLLGLLYDIRMVVPLEAEFCGYWDKKSVSTWDTKKPYPKKPGYEVNYDTNFSLLDYEYFGDPWVAGNAPKNKIKKNKKKKLNNKIPTLLGRHTATLVLPRKLTPSQVQDKFLIRNSTL